METPVKKEKLTFPRGVKWALLLGSPKSWLSSVLCHQQAETHDDGKREACSKPVMAPESGSWLRNAKSKLIGNVLDVSACPRRV